ncbi:acyl-CoA thioesterase [Litoribrevibacter albus]|uniref:Acyl-CoA thioesterase n=1 Tax=Litoribrevibacter albus TaxID=1473156 RepID=A0AA37SEK6_9GAMM|nr:thioesterase family protein [Litoribrevibacter albus]GLQ32599.1 acyl-CoA thioesterase [Litoribrevibacter albus]
MQRFHEIIKQIASQQQEYDIQVPEHWGQGRATFGGLIGGILYRAMRFHVDQDRRIRSLNISFVGPVSPGPMQVIVNVLRNGGSVTHVEARAVQNDQVQCMALASFGSDRESSIEVPAKRAPEARIPVEEAKELPYIKGVTPEFVQQIRMRWIDGGFPFSGSQSNIIDGYMQFRDQAEQLDDQAFDETALITLIDGWPPIQLSKMKKPSPASSLTWALEFIQPIENLTKDSWLRYQVDIDHSHNGYGQNHAQIWSESGELLAISRQTVTVFG